MPHRSRGGLAPARRASSSRARNAGRRAGCGAGVAGPRDRRSRRPAQPIPPAWKVPSPKADRPS
ncbi:hypothetical protein DK389_27025 [Methylobacterium durans]|uniref:Uncharacterized protein n=1 Tax=Methylobacterium durans TaxID=2202825 RepID=A0A2U8WBN6_9HYPH|nr:hypothetical protein DK389_27025 [Methylobacterium durans]